MILCKHSGNVVPITQEYTDYPIAGAGVQSGSALQDGRATTEGRHGRFPRHQHLPDPQAMQLQLAVEAFSPGATATGTGGESARHRAAVDGRARGDDAQDDLHSDARGRGAPWQRRVSGTEAPTGHVHGERASSPGRSTGVVGIARTAGERSDVQDESGKG